MLSRTVTRALLPSLRGAARLSPAPSPSSLVLSSFRSFTSSSRHLQPRAARSAKEVDEKPEESGQGKIQTVPFQIAPQRGLHISETAAHSAFGVTYVLRLLLARFFKRFFGIDKEAYGGFFDTGVKKVAFTPLLLPMWKVDLAMKGKALLDQAELSLSISALNASLPGFRLDPLDRLAVSPPFEVPPIPFDPSTHLTPFASLPSTPDFPSGQPAVTLIPFTRTPLNALSKVSSFPRTIASPSEGEGGGGGGLSLDPKKFEPVLFAAYPLYVPMFLGEFELEDQTAPDGETLRVTTATFATVDGTAFAVYPQFLSQPSWLPSSSSVDLSISGRPSNPSDLPSPEALKNLKPKLEEALEELKEKFVSGNVGAGELDPSAFTEAIGKGEGGFEKYVEGQGRAMGFAEWSDLNREYVDAVFEADTAAAFLSQVEGMPDAARTVLLSSSSLPKVTSRTSLLSDMRLKLSQAKEKVEALKPEWIERVEREERERREAGLRSRAEGRGREGRGRA